MRILELHMKHFGKFEDQRMRFCPGMNLIYGSNEAGKSTVHAFIRAMLFGIDPPRGRAGKKDEYTLRQPWENGSYFAGSLRLAHGGKIYRIERNFYKSDQSMKLICESDGQELPADSLRLQQFLNGMDEACFANTIFIPQAGTVSEEGLADVIRSWMLNLQESGDGGTDVAGAVERLQRQQREADRKRREAEKRIQEQIDRKKIELEYWKGRAQEAVHPEGGAVLAEAFNTSRPDVYPGGEQSDPGQVEIPAGTQEETSAGTGEEAQPGAGDLKKGLEKFLRFLQVSSVLVALLGGLCAFAVEEIWLKVLTGAVGALAVVFFLLLSDYVLRTRRGEHDALTGDRAGDRHADLGRHAADQERYGILGRHADGKAASDRLGLEQTDRAAERAGEGRESGGRAAGERDKELEALRLRALRQESLALSERAGEELAELYREQDKVRRPDEEQAALALALERIRELSADVHKSRGMDVGQSASQILSVLTDGRYSKISLDERMQVRISTGERLLHLYEVSFGTMQQIYFALRIAAGQLFEGEALPLILDEPFAMYDEERREKALRYLRGTRRQVILFTCVRAASPDNG